MTINNRTLPEAATLKRKNSALLFLFLELLCRTVHKIVGFITGNQI